MRRDHQPQPNDKPIFRIPIPDDASKKLFSEPAVEALLDFLPDFKRLFTAYMPENYDKQAIVSKLSQ